MTSPRVRSILVHEYVTLDMQRVVEAMEQLEPMRTFLKIVATLEAESER